MRTAGCKPRYDAKLYTAVDQVLMRKRYSTVEGIRSPPSNTTGRFVGLKYKEAPVS